MSGRRATFLDRDGTIIEDVGYLRSPADVRLLPGAARAVHRLNQAGWAVVVVTNQSGIARGLFTTQDYEAGEKQVDQLLQREGARIDAHYFCPHLPEVTGPCECRKPGVRLYRQAAEELGIDLSQSWWVGDQLRDVLPAESLGGRGILLGETEAGAAEPGRFLRAPDLTGAVQLIEPS